jgi:hypothetical protein
MLQAILLSKEQELVLIIKTHALIVSAQLQLLSIVTNNAELYFCHVLNAVGVVGEGGRVNKRFNTDFQ